MSDEEDMNRLSIQAQVLQRQGQTLQGQLDALQATVTDLNSTIETLENLPKAKDVGMLPIGSGAYITCHKVDTEMVLISVGAGLVVSKKASEAAEILKGRLKNVSEAFENAQRNLMSINQRLQDIEAQASTLAAKMENVRPSQE